MIAAAVAVESRRNAYLAYESDQRLAIRSGLFGLIHGRGDGRLLLGLRQNQEASHSLLLTLEHFRL